MYNSEERARFQLRRWRETTKRKIYGKSKSGRWLCFFVRLPMRQSEGLCFGGLKMIWGDWRNDMMLAVSNDLEIAAAM